MRIHSLIFLLPYHLERISNAPREELVEFAEDSLHTGKWTTLHADHEKWCSDNIRSVCLATSMQAAVCILSNNFDDQHTGCVFKLMEYQIDIYNYHFPHQKNWPRLDRNRIMWHSWDSKGRIRVDIVSLLSQVVNKQLSNTLISM